VCFLFYRANYDFGLLICLAWQILTICVSAQRQKKKQNKNIYISKKGKQQKKNRSRNWRHPCSPFISCPTSGLFSLSPPFPRSIRHLLFFATFFCFFFFVFHPPFLCNKKYEILLKTCWRILYWISYSKIRFWEEQKNRRQIKNKRNWSGKNWLWQFFCSLGDLKLR